MAFQLGDDESGGLNEINLIPLIDIMLVLMIIFLVTATVLKPTVPLSLPKTSAKVSKQPEKSIQISINKTGDLFWDDKPIVLSALPQKMQKSKSTATAKLPTITIRADKDAKYDVIAKVLAAASEVGLTDIAFVNEAPALTN